MALSDRDYMRPAPPAPGGQGLRITWRLDAVTVLLALNVGVFLWQHVVMDHKSGLWGALSLPALMEGRVWTLFTHMFVHHDLGHLVANMLMLFMAGKSLQLLIGAKKFLYLYFLAGLVAAAFEFGIHRIAGHDFNDFVMYGASGATCGVFLGLAAMLPHQEVTAMIYFIIPVRMRLWNMATLLMGTSIGFGLLNVTGYGVDNIAHFAHLGGALTGWWFVRMLGYNGRPVTYGRLVREHQERDQPHEFAGIVRRRRAVDMEEQDNAITPQRKTRELIEQEIDPILEKIHAQGLASLTDAERDVLNRAREEMLREQN